MFYSSCPQLGVVKIIGLARQGSCTFLAVVVIHNTMERGRVTMIF